MRTPYLRICRRPVAATQGNVIGRKLVRFLWLLVMVSMNCQGACAFVARVPATVSRRQPHTELGAMKVNIRIVGRKTSELWLEDGVQMYETRLQPSNVEVETTWHKDNAALMKGVETDQSKQHTIVLMDLLGKTMTSEVFADKLYDWLEEGGSRLSFIIGGAEGLPPELKYPSYGKSGKQPSSYPLISLSALTFTHQFARLLLIEQIYRATEIRKGSGYHK